MRAGGRAGRAAEEVHVDDHLHLFRRVREQELQIRVPSAGERRPVRHDDDGLHRAELEKKFGKEPKDLRVAIIHEDGAYGVDVAKGNEAGAKKAGFNVVMKEGYSATAPDLSALVTKLKRARPDVIFHTGYNPDITLLFRQAREQGLKFGAIVGHGAGYGVYEKLKEGLGGDANFLFNTDPISIWLANRKRWIPSCRRSSRWWARSSTN